MTLHVVGQNENWAHALMILGLKRRTTSTGTIDHVFGEVTRMMESSDMGPDLTY